MTNIYYFASHRPDPKMIEDLGHSITARFAGDISDVHRQDKQIAFTELLHIGGERIKICHTIPAESIVVIEATLLLQSDWLNAGVATLLVPQMRQEAGAWGNVAFKYCGLIQVHKIEVITSQWTNSGAEGQPADRPTQPTQTEAPGDLTPSLFDRLRRNPLQQNIF